MLVFDNVRYHYPFTETSAVQEIDFSAAAGRAILCTGGSGCGKSTLIRLANGLAPHFFRGTLAGKIMVAGTDNAHRLIHDISHDVGTLFQDPEQQFFALNVADELAFAHEWRNTPQQRIQALVDEAAKRFGITELLDSSVHQLSEGQKQKVALAGIMSLSPSVLILDEPSANLDPEATEELALMLVELKKAGVTLMIVDHRLYWLQGLIDEVLVMENGVIAQKTSFDALHDEGMRQRYGLRNTVVNDRRQEISCVRSRQGSITINNLTFAYRGKAPLFENFSVTLPKGEVVGIVGDNGVGKTTFARLMTGLLKMQSGSISIDGLPVPPGQLMKRSAIVLQNTDHQLHMHTVRRELEAACRLLNPQQQALAVEQTLADYRIEHLAERHPQSLSGGEKQRLVIACAAIRKPELLILDEPTSGLDGANMAMIADNVRNIAAQGTCVLVISHDLELLERVCTCQLDLGRKNASVAQ